MQVKDFKREILAPMSADELRNLLGASNGCDLKDYIVGKYHESFKATSLGDSLFIIKMANVELFSTTFNAAYQIALYFNIPFKARFSNDGEIFHCSFVISDLSPEMPDHEIISSVNMVTYEEETKRLYERRNK